MKIYIRESILILIIITSFVIVMSLDTIIVVKLVTKKRCSHGNKETKEIL